MRKLASIALGLAAALSALILASVCLAILEIYLSGHGYPTLMDRPVIEYAGSGTRLSIADLIAVAVGTLAGLASAWLTWPSRPHGLTAPPKRPHGEG